VAIAVVAAAVLLGGGYLVAQYRDEAGQQPVAGVPGPTPSRSRVVFGETPTLQPSIAPGGISISKKPSASASKKATSAGKGGFPGSHNTGVPAGTNLSKYTGPCTVTKDKTVVSNKTVNCDPFTIRARNVTIRASRINGSLVTTEATSFSFLLEDSEVDAGVYQGPAVGSTNMTIRRANIHGGQTAVLCYANCDIRDSWLHGQRLPAGSDWHLGGFLANDTDGSGDTDVTLVHNTIVCDSPSNSAGGGCSGNVNLFADFGPVSNVTVRGNLLGANEDISYCVYGGSTSGKAHTDGVRDIVIEDNVFQRGGNRKCGAYGPVTSFDGNRPGNSWKNNVWEDGSPVAPAN
jgi:hypothetical protein